MTASLSTLAEFLVDGVKARHIQAGCFRLDGNSLYHFGTHYLMARILPGGELFLNTYRYSSRTGQAISKLAREILYRLKYPERLVLRFSSGPEVDDNRWWGYHDRPPLAQVLSMEIGRLQGSEGVLETVRRLYPVQLDDDWTVPLQLWGGDLDALREVLGHGDDAFLPILHTVALKLGPQAAEELVMGTDWRHRNRTVRDTAVRRLLHRYDGLQTIPEALAGFERRFWGLIMAAPESRRPVLATELLLKPSLQEYAHRYINAYNNRMAHNEILRVRSLAGVQ